jgi:hypothetical protein
VPALVNALDPLPPKAEDAIWYVAVPPGVKVRFVIEAYAPPPPPDPALELLLVAPAAPPPAPPPIVSILLLLEFQLLGTLNV